MKHGDTARRERGPRQHQPQAEPSNGEAPHTPPQRSAHHAPRTYTGRATEPDKAMIHIANSHAPVVHSPPTSDSTQHRPMRQTRIREPQARPPSAHSAPESTISRQHPPTPTRVRRPVDNPPASTHSSNSHTSPRPAAHTEQADQAPQPLPHKHSPTPIMHIMSSRTFEGLPTTTDTPPARTSPRPPESAPPTHTFSPHPQDGQQSRHLP